ncbi:MAG: DUF5606 domain-containing protein [Bacteroidales bacterium]|nr:DUF5606 domain-containing protein [Bacteroidales bacterium]
MDLSKVLAISGKPGLYKMLTQTKNGMVVESITDGKRFTAFTHEQISTLEEISIYTDDEDKPLKEVLKAMYDKLEGKEALSHKSDAEALKAFFEEAVPDYDKENVYISDIKKVIQWYNILQENNMLDFTEEEKKDEVPAEKEKAPDEKQETDEAVTSNKDKQEN